MGSRFVNLLAMSCNGGPRHFSLHCLNPANLFRLARSRPAVRAVHGWPADARLPPPSLSFDWPCTKGEQAWMNFMAFGPGRENLLAVDQIGRSFLYNHGSRLLRTGMPKMRKPINDPISVAVGDSLYVMSSNPGRLPDRDCFQALLHTRLLASYAQDWCWYSLQPPPFFAADDDGVDRSSCRDAPMPFEISAYAVVDDSQIWISTSGAGTYSYDIASGAWSKLRNWALPFKGRVEYIPEHNLWFGFTPDDLQLCTSDLTASCELRPPVLQDVWTDVNRPEDWTLTDASIVLLGSGQVCVARFFLTCPEESIEDVYGYALEKTENFAVLAGVKLLKAEWAQLRMVKHKSERYVFGRDLVIPL
ncbi:uncharacterized protein [Aegilops tauschii subsp. strangulata]|uniref:uncharacterized protein n=1 Tax=Aegilops tauschii subsp. strangulata TaxID=200361 RepID=UPI003CC8C809